uniref:(northern house mosquito) hypothetical protein n=1 Tax=Culex pipiens TaxID=7175 RepID=A0A8D8GP89_CULPI
MPQSQQPRQMSYRFVHSTPPSPRKKSGFAVSGPPSPPSCFIQQNFPSRLLNDPIAFTFRPSLEFRNILHSKMHRNFTQKAEYNDSFFFSADRGAYLQYFTNATALRFFCFSHLLSQMPP